MSEKKKKDPVLAIVPKYARGDSNKAVEGINKLKDRKLKGSIKRREKTFKEAAYKAASSEILLTEDAGFLEPEGIEKTYQLSQRSLAKEVDVATSHKMFSLDLKFGPYSLDYTRNGRHLLIGGRKGHVAAFDWQAGRLGCELQLRETVRDVTWLHNETMFAVAQKKYVYIYDKQGTEIHCLRNHIEVNKLDFLPYHFLLTSVGNSGFLKYQDTSTGNVVAEHRTKLGKCDVMTQNPATAIMHLGHGNGTVTLWSPNMSTPLVKMQCHRGPVTAIAIGHTGTYMATAGLDGQLKLWDLRSYKPMQEYFTPTPASSLSVSQRGLLAVGFGPHVSIWKDPFKSKQVSPYMNHLQAGSAVQDVEFVPFEDVLGFGHRGGISSIIVPGSGEPNFDALEANPFQTKKQRQEMEVHSLLEKIQPEMITLDVGMVGQMDKAPVQVLNKEKKEAWAAAHPEKATELKFRARGKNSSSRRHLRKKAKNIVDQKKVDLLERIENDKKERAKKRAGNPDEPATALDRFSGKRRKF
ncbi:Small subunit (SSU) processome component [Mortierella sp. GBA35]|nr:Small subunit (SSU) processome component [Mortierella sp. AD031]KAF9098668.1 Small subunit (SSU) processome component [Mortierella sp. GBA35]KAG0207201.1 Small subunit (SSU) processome component [Mortierella sp. NVP41]